MTVAAPPTVLLVDSPTQPVRSTVEQALRGRLVALTRVQNAEEALAWLRCQDPADPGPAAALIAPGADWPLAIARQLRKAAPDMRLVFLTESAEGEPLRRSLLFEPLLGAAWDIVALSDPAQLGQRLEEIVRAAERQRSHRATLARLSTQIAGFQAPPLRERLVLAESHLATLLAFADEPIVATDPAGRVVSWNAAAERVLGVRATEAEGQLLSDLLQLDPVRPDETEVRQLLDQVRQASEPRVLERSWRSPRAGASTMEVEIRLAPIFGPQGEFLGALGRVTDVTARKRRERALQAQLAVTRLLASAPAQPETLAHILASVCECLGWSWGELWEPDEAESLLRCTAVWHAEAAPLLGFSAVTESCRLQRGEGLPGRAWESGQPVWVSEVAQEENFPRADAATAAGFHGAFAFPVRANDETLAVLCFLSTQNEPSDPELLQALAAISQQIGQFMIRSRAEATLRFLAEVSEVLAASLEFDVTLARLTDLTVPFLADCCYVDILERDGSIRRVAAAHVDPRQKPLLDELRARYTPTQDSPAPAGQVLRSGKPVYFPRVDPAIVTAGTLDTEHAGLVHRLQVSSHISVPMPARGEIIGVINLTRTQGRHYTLQDLQTAEELARRAGMAVDNARLYQEARALERELRQRAEELLRAGEAKDVFLAMLAHELRNPLAPIQNAAEVLRARGGDALARTGQVIERNVQHLTRIVDDLLDVSRITRGQIELRREPVDLAAVVQEAVEISRPLIAERQHRLSVSTPRRPVTLYADPTRLGQVIANLLNNAAKYTEPGGEIRLSAAAEGEQAVIRVSDTGVGIPQEMLPRIFELFTQVNPTLDRSQGGLGLGLTLVRSLVEMHGGTVEAHSAGPGRGSEFLIRLPALPETRTARTTQRDTHSQAGEPAQKLCILVVDDNVDAAETLAEVLELWGHQTDLAFDGPSALRHLRDTRPDVVLLDIGLPHMSGYEVAAHLRGERDVPQPVLVALTGYGQEEDRRRTQEAGFDHHLVKPVNLDHLREILLAATQRTIRE